MKGWDDEKKWSGHPGKNGVECFPGEIPGGHSVNQNSPTETLEGCPETETNVSLIRINDCIYSLHYLTLN